MAQGTATDGYAAVRCPAMAGDVATEIQAYQLLPAPSEN
jgi:hypothetical protein